MNAERHVDWLHSFSELGQQVDLLFLCLLLVTGTVALGVAALIVYFAIRYRRGSAADRSSPPDRARWLEITWTVLPLAIFLVIFLWSSIVFSRFYQPPRNALRVNVMARQWMWKLEHDNGRREIDELHVPVNTPVELIMTSQDVIHSFFIPAFRVKQDVLPGRYTSLWFTATRTGQYNLFCAEFCGTDHSGMHGSVIVMQPAAFARWLASDPQPGTVAQQGFALYRKLACGGCHERNATISAPALDDLYGTTVHLSDGSSARVDDNYLRDAIIAPDKQIAAGYAPVMPSFKGQLDEESLAALIAYLRSRHGPAAEIQ